MICRRCSTGPCQCREQDQDGRVSTERKGINIWQKVVDGLNSTSTECQPSDDPDLRSKFDQALLSLGRLDSVSTLLPDTSLLLYVYVRKEAVLSSMIEGTQSSLSDLLLFELDQEPGVPLDDVREVSNYVAALDHGLRLIFCT